MNSKRLRASSRTWARLLLIACVAIVLAGSAYATPSTNIAPSSMFRPRGMVRVQVGSAGPDYWVADGASGFCRLDNGAVNLSTCFLGGTAEPYDDRPNSPYVFIADATGTGVNRFTFGVDPTNSAKTAIATAENVLGSVSGITYIGAPVGKLRTEAAKIGPDGNLYVVNQGDGNIVRVTNPRDPRPPSPTIQKASVVASSSNGKRLVSMAFIGNDLWAVQAGFAERIQNITSCVRITVACTGVLQYQNIQFPMGMASDGTRYIYFSSGSEIVRLDTTLPGLQPSTALFQIWSNTGILNGTPVSYSLPRGLNIHPAGANGPNDPGGDMFITDDITIEAPLPEVAAPLVRTGRAWLLSAVPAVTPEPGLVDSTAGIGNPLTPNARQASAATTGILRATGVTHPRGLIYLGSSSNGHFWVADEVKGLCRIDATGAGRAALTNCVKPSSSFIAGQPAADTPAVSKTANPNVYLPDISGSSAGIFRYTFNPTTQTLSQTGVLSQGRGSIASALAISPQGDLYIGPTTGSQVTKIITPATAPSAATAVASTLNGQGVRSMAFNGNDLYMMENGSPQQDSLYQTGSGQQTMILKAAPDLARGRADFFSGVGQFIQLPRGTPPPTDIDTPAAVAVGPTGQVPCNTVVTTFSPTTPSIFMGGAAEVDQWSTLCSKDTLWTADGQFSALLTLQAPIGVVTALGFAPDGTLAIGDDPSLLPLTSNLNSTTKSPTTAQGHVYVVLSQ
jgi:hypothetical protein